MNRFKALLLLATLTGLVVWAGQLVGGTTGMVVALAFAAVMNLGAWWWSDKLVLRMYGAREISEAGSPELYGIVRALAQRARIPMPRVYVIPEEAPNASVAAGDGASLSSSTRSRAAGCCASSARIPRPTRASPACSPWPARGCRLALTRWRRACSGKKEPS